MNKGCVPGALILFFPFLCFLAFFKVLRSVGPICTQVELKLLDVVHF